MQEPGSPVSEVPEVKEVKEVKEAPKLEQAPSEAEGESTSGSHSSGGASTFELARRILVGVVQAVEDGANLVGASLGEELGRFREDIVRSLVAVAFLATGGGLLTSGVALLLYRWMGSWSPVLLVMGGVYVAVGFWLLYVRRAKEGGD